MEEPNKQVLAKEDQLKPEPLSDLKYVQHQHNFTQKAIRQNFERNSVLESS